MLMETPTFIPLPENVIAQLNAVSSATISYQLAKRGFGNTFMAGIAPLQPDLRLCGRAVTLRYIPVRTDLLKHKKEDANAQRQLIESIGAGEVLVIDARGTTASFRTAASAITPPFRRWTFRLMRAGGTRR
jgi:5-oxopent-3-ene-1,2,5-tricarboxylate decarboxylase/2-hydroxyhepta-2,4-diene-1,7-dioate isomerase